MSIDSSRQNLILSLKDQIRKLTGQLHASPKPLFNEQNQLTNELCDIIEKILFQGIRTKEFNGQVPFWGLLERLESNLPVYPVIRNSVAAVSYAGNLRTPLSKARGWIRQVLNTNGLDESIAIFTKDARVISIFYSSQSIMRYPEEVSTLVTVIKALKIMPFCINADDKSLNNTPSWLTEAIAKNVSIYIHLIYIHLIYIYIY
jgi:hypothetical protein